MALNDAERQARLQAKQTAETEVIRKQLDEAWAEIDRLRNLSKRGTAEGARLMEEHAQKRAKLMEETAQRRANAAEAKRRRREALEARQ